MPDYSLPLILTFVVGNGSCGKTGFCFRYLLNAEGVACRFIFDDRGQAAQRLVLKPCNTFQDCEDAVPTGWVCFNPHVMFPGAKLKAGFKWFCKWAMQVSGRGLGRKILFVDELWQWVDVYSVPDELEDIVRTGRAFGLELLSATHSPRDYHRDIKRMVTEWVCFNIVEPDDLKSIRPYWPGVDKITTLPRGKFIAYSRESGQELAGQIF